MVERICPYCKGSGVQMLATRAAGLEDKGMAEERHAARVMIEPVHCWKCNGTGKIVE